MKFSTLYRFSLIVLLFSFVSADVFGITKTFTGNGNFGDPTKWNGGTLPVAGNDLIINGTCTVDNNVATDNVAYATIIIGNGPAGILKWAVGGTNRLKITNVSSNVAGSCLDMTNGGTFIIVGSWTQANMSFIPGAGTIERQGTITISAYPTFNNLIINGTITTGTNMNLTGTLAITSGSLIIGAFSFDVAGTTTITTALTISSATGTKTFGNIINNGTFNNTAANEDISISGNFQNNGVYNGGTGRVTFTGASSNTISGTAATTAFNGGITINKGASNANVLDVQSKITIPAGGLTLTNGTFKLTSASTITPFTANIAAPPYLIPSTAGLWCNGGTMNSTINMGWNYAGLLRVSAGNLNQGFASGNFLSPENGASLIVDGGNLNIAGRLNNTGTTWTFTMTGGTVTVNTVGSAIATRYPFNMDMAACSFNVSGGTIIIHQSAGAAGENLGYNNLATGGTGFTGGTLQIGDATTPVSQTMKIVSTNPVYNLWVNSANATVQLQTSNLTVNNVTITAGTLNTNNLNLTANGNFVNTASGIFLNNAILSVKGNITNDQAAMIAGTGTTNLNGTIAQTVSGSQPYKTFNLGTNNAAGILLNNNLSISGVHTFSSGVITTSATPNYLIYEAGSSYSGDADSRHVNGWVKKIGSTNFAFPVGNGTVERKISLVSLSIAGDFNVKYAANTPNTSLMQSPIVGVDKNEYWIVNKISGGSASLTLNWDNSKVTFPNWMLTDIRAVYYNGINWSNVGGIAVGNPITTGTITSNSISSFNFFTFGSQGFVLPLHLINFTAQRINNSTKLDWLTSNEENVSHFEVQRSNDNSNFYTIAQFPARNIPGVQAYSAYDNEPINRIAYYRIISVDIDGHTIVSKTIAVTLTNSNKLLLLANPVQDAVTLTANGQLNGVFHYSILAMNGQLIQQGNLVIQNGGQYQLQLRSTVKPGAYILQVNNPSQSFQYKFIRQ